MRTARLRTTSVASTRECSLDDWSLRLCADTLPIAAALPGTVDLAVASSRLAPAPWTRSARTFFATPWKPSPFRPPKPQFCVVQASLCRTDHAHLRQPFTSPCNLTSLFSCHPLTLRRSTFAVVHYNSTLCFHFTLTRLPSSHFFGLIVRISLCTILRQRIVSS